MPSFNATPIRRVTGKFREVKLDPAQVEAKMSAFVHMVGRIFRQANTEIQPDSALQFEEVELAVKISAKGQIKLIAGGEVGGEGGITFKFKRSDSKGNGIPPTGSKHLSIEFWPHPQKPIDTVSFEAETNVNYLRLRDLLKAQNWEAADQETLEVMVEATNRACYGWLDSYNHGEFPCKDLQTIDRLWVTASKGQFGFSVQKEIYVHCGGQLDRSYASDEAWNKFGDEVSWRIHEEWQSYTDSSPPKIGFFPWRPFGFSERWRGCIPSNNFAALVLRLVNCREELSVNS